MTVHDHPTNGRMLLCTTCQATIRVYEIPRQFLDPKRFVCGNCLRGDVAMSLDDMTETRRYDPKQSTIPF